MLGKIFNKIDLKGPKATPFRVGVHFDSDDVINAAAANLADNIENAAPTGIAGIGYNGFYMAYWQNTCA